MKPITRITVDAPGKNAMSSEVMTALTAEIETAGGAPLLVVGAGDALSAGLDLREVASLDIEGMRAFLGRLERLMATLYLYPGPTAVAVNGHAIAGGCILALCCDYRVATTNPRAKIGLNEVALGLHFPPRIMAIIRGRVPRRHLEQVLLSAGLFDPAEACRLGLVDEVAEDAEAGARAWLEAVAGHSAEAYAAVKRSIRGRLHFDDDEYDRFLDEALPSWTSDALKARIRAMLGGS
jgi:enoyl-CoA hydratase/carnithine racemase